MLKGTRPDLTPAQIIGLLIAAVPALASLLRAFGVFDLTAVQTAALTEALQWAAVAASTLFVADAGLRAARNAAEAKTIAAVATSSDPQGTALAAGLSTGPATDPTTGLTEVSDPEAEEVRAEDLPDDDTEFEDPDARAVAEDLASDPDRP